MSKEGEMRAHRGYTQKGFNFEKRLHFNDIKAREKKNAQKKDVKKEKQKVVQKDSSVCESEKYSQCAYERWVQDLNRNIDEAVKLLGYLKMVFERIILEEKV